MNNDEKKLLLHCCCGPCSTTCIKRLIDENYKITLWFSNDNIFPEDEFYKRYENLLIVAKHYNLDVLIKPYEHSSWLKSIEGYEEEREGGKRCGLCFKYNLEITGEKAKELGFTHFATTLTVSRYKNSKRIFSIGENIDGFEPLDFKKKGGYEESIRLSREYGLYRQHYCGCEFSYKEALEYQKRKAEKQ